MEPAAHVLGNTGALYFQSRMVHLQMVHLNLIDCALV